MEEVYVPYLDCKDFKKIVKIVSIEDNSQQIIINGKRISNKNKRTALCCPSCGEILQPLNVPTGKMREIIGFCNTNADLLERNMNKCPKCGQKLAYLIDVMEGVYDEKLNS